MRIDQLDSSLIIHFFQDDFIQQPVRWVCPPLNPSVTATWNLDATIRVRQPCEHGQFAEYISQSLASTVLFFVICRSQVIRMMMLNWLLMWTDVLGQILSPVLQVFGHSGHDPLLCAQVLSLDSPDDAPVLTFSGAT